MLEQIGQGQSAADVYRNALKIAPPRALPAGQSRARLITPPASSADSCRGPARPYAQQGRRPRGKVGPATLDRFDEGLEIYAGLKTRRSRSRSCSTTPACPPSPSTIAPSSLA